MGPVQDAPLTTRPDAAELEGQLEQQLALGGRLVAPVADEEGEQLVLVRRLEGGFERHRLEAVRFVPLL